MEIGYVIRDARKWEVDPERTASKLMLAIIEGCLRRLSRRHRLCFQQYPIHDFEMKHIAKNSRV